jgi:hypothetical protein
MKKKSQTAIIIIIIISVLSVSGVLIWGFTSNWGQPKKSGSKSKQKEKAIGDKLKKIEKEIEEVKKDPTVGKKERVVLDEVKKEVIKAVKNLDVAETIPTRSNEQNELDTACGCNAATYGGYCKEWDRGEDPWCYTNSSENTTCSAWDRGKNPDDGDRKKWRRCTPAQTAAADNAYNITKGKKAAKVNAAAAASSGDIINRRKT